MPVSFLATRLWRTALRRSNSRWAQAPATPASSVSHTRHRALCVEKSYRACTPFGKALPHPAQTPSYLRVSWRGRAAGLPPSGTGVALMPLHNGARPGFLGPPGELKPADGMGLLALRPNECAKRRESTALECRSAAHSMTQRSEGGLGGGVLRPEYQSPGRVHLSTRLNLRICSTRHAERVTEPN